MCVCRTCWRIASPLLHYGIGHSEARTLKLTPLISPIHSCLLNTVINKRRGIKNKVQNVYVRTFGSITIIFMIFSNNQELI